MTVEQLELEIQSICDEYLRYPNTGSTLDELNYKLNVFSNQHEIEKIKAIEKLNDPTSLVIVKSVLHTEYLKCLEELEEYKVICADEYSGCDPAVYRVLISEHRERILELELELYGAPVN